MKPVIRDNLLVVVNPLTKEILRGPFPSEKGAKAAKVAAVNDLIGLEYSNDDNLEIKMHIMYESTIKYPTTKAIAKIYSYERDLLLTVLGPGTALLQCILIITCLGLNIISTFLKLNPQH